MGFNSAFIKEMRKKKDNNEEGLQNWNERRIKTYQLQRQNEGILVNAEKLKRKNSNVEKRIWKVIK
jgi:hypothetical protein